MRLKLHLQSAELLVNESGLQFRGVQFKAQRFLRSLLIIAVITEPVLDAQHGPVHQNVAVKAARYSDQEYESPHHRAHVGGKDAQVWQNQSHQSQVNYREYDAEQKVRREAAYPDPTLDRESPADAKYHRRKQGKSPHSHHPGYEVVPPWRRIAHDDLAGEILAEEKGPDHRPRKKVEWIPAKSCVDVFIHGAEAYLICRQPRMRVERFPAHDQGERDRT